MFLMTIFQYAKELKTLTSLTILTLCNKKQYLPHILYSGCKVFILVKKTGLMACIYPFVVYSIKSLNFLRETKQKRSLSQSKQFGTPLKVNREK